MAQDVALGPLGQSIQTGEIDDGAVTYAKLDTGARPSLVLIDTQSISAGTTASFTSIPAHNVYVLKWYTHNNNSSTAGRVVVWVQFNNETGADYFYDKIEDAIPSYTDAATKIPIGASYRNASGHEYDACGMCLIHSEGDMINLTNCSYQYATVYLGGCLQKNTTLSEIDIIVDSTIDAEFALYYDSNLED